MFRPFELHPLEEIMQHYTLPYCVQKHSWSKQTFFVAKRFDESTRRLIGIIFPEDGPAKWCYIEKLDRKYRVFIPKGALPYYEAAGVEPPFGADGFDQFGYDRDGYNRSGYDTAGYDRNGFDASGLDGEGFDADGYNRKGYDRRGYDRRGRDRNGLDRDGYDRNGFDSLGIHRET